MDRNGTVYVTATNDHTIRQITAAGVVSTLAGQADQIGSTDGPGATARFSGPVGLAVDSRGTVYVGDSNNHTIRWITAAGVVSTLAGQAGTSGSTDAPSRSAARFNVPRGVAVDSSGNLYVGDILNHTIRKILGGAAAPVATITSPTTGAFLRGTVTLRATLAATLTSLAWSYSLDGATFTPIGAGSSLSSTNTQSWDTTAVAPSGQAKTRVTVRVQVSGPGGDTTATVSNLTLDNTVPAPPSAPDLVAASDRGTSSTDNRTNATTPTLTGTAEANSTVTVFAGTTSLGTTTADTTGAWTFTATSALPDGTYSLTATATDAAGNVSAASPALTVTLDAKAPGAPAITTITTKTQTVTSFPAKLKRSDDRDPTRFGLQVTVTDRCIGC